MGGQRTQSFSGFSEHCELQSILPHLLEFIAKLSTPAQLSEEFRDLPGSLLPIPLGNSECFSTDLWDTPLISAVGYSRPYCAPTGLSESSDMFPAIFSPLSSWIPKKSVTLREHCTQKGCVLTTLPSSSLPHKRKFWNSVCDSLYRGVSRRSGEPGVWVRGGYIVKNEWPVERVRVVRFIKFISINHYLPLFIFLDLTW